MEGGVLLECKEKISREGEIFILKGGIQKGENFVKFANNILSCLRSFCGGSK